ncbi:MAG: methionine--tRNA ligase, partial [Bdellovibrionota bacterium]
MSQYLTTPLYYVNAQPHLGHAFTTILADFLKRHYQQRDVPTIFLTGTDEHGEKIAQYAAQAGMSPQKWADQIAGDFKKTWDTMGIAYDVFYRTTAPSHVKAVQAALQYLFDRKEIVFREYEGLYCLGCERFRTETELTADGNCPDHERAPERRKESNYFFKMSAYQDRLIEHYRKNPSAIQPEHYRNEMLSHLKEPLEDLCISRPKERLTWGIEIPFDAKYVTYVWFDALLNYLVATGWQDPTENRKNPESAAWRQQWGQSRHLIAKDILRTHAVYWPTMLMALGVPVFRELNVHGYWLVGESKMSKSLGNVIRPLEFSEKYGGETLRFYLLKEMSFGLDATFTVEAFIQSSNAHLANGIGNLCSRVLTLCHKGFM